GDGAPPEPRCLDPGRQSSTNGFSIDPRSGDIYVALAVEDGTDIAFLDQPGRIARPRARFSKLLELLTNSDSEFLRIWFRRDFAAISPQLPDARRRTGQNPCPVLAKHGDGRCKKCPGPTAAASSVSRPANPRLPSIAAWAWPVWAALRCRRRCSRSGS